MSEESRSDNEDINEATPSSSEINSASTVPLESNKEQLKLVVESLPNKFRYSPGEEIDYTGLKITCDGKDVTSECSFSVEQGTKWDNDDKSINVIASFDASDPKPKPVVFTLVCKKPFRTLRNIVFAILAVIIAAILASSLILRVPPQDIPILFTDTVGITHSNAPAHAIIEGTTSFQSPLRSDTTWKADTVSQHFVMANPAGNTVALAPHIYVDLDGDGKFSDDECIYNSIEYDRQGNVTSYGVFIDVGRQLEDIEIEHPLDAGVYRAKVLYTAVDKETSSLCNGNEFVFDLTVE